MRTPQRVTQDLVIPENSYVRVHVMPKRFPAVYSVSWAVRAGGWPCVLMLHGGHAVAQSAAFAGIAACCGAVCRVCWHSSLPWCVAAFVRIDCGALKPMQSSLRPVSQDRVVANTPDFVVVSKPAGVPAAPTVDNLIECAPSCAAEVGWLGCG